MCDKEPIFNIVGNQIALGPWEREHGDAFKRWMNDYGTARTWETLPGPWTEVRLDRVYDGYFNKPEDVYFAVYDCRTLAHIGLTLLYQVDHVNRIAEFGILIGDVKNRGKGYGTEATLLTLDHAFTAFGLSNVFLRVFEYNLAGIRAYEKAGFTRMGVRRNSKFMGGKLWDTIYMDAVAEEFESPVLASMLAPDQPRVR